MTVQPSPRAFRTAAMALVGCVAGVFWWSAIHSPGARAEDAPADAATGDDPCECDGVVAKAKARIAALETTAAKLADKPAGLIIRDAEGNLIGRVITVSAYAGYVGFRVIHPDNDTPFGVAMTGDLDPIKLLFDGPDCTGNAFAEGGEGIAPVPGTDQMWIYQKGAEKVTFTKMGTFYPHTGECSLPLKPTTKSAYPMVLVPKPFPIPVKLPLSVE